MSNTTKDRPAYRVFSVSKKETDPKPVWIEIGAAWPHKDGKGFNITFKASPFGEAKIVLRKPKAAKQGEAQ
ncbi:MAG TPA: hypothetical protein VGG27_18795 [Magnetospirillaceae bacterium]|jgi:hypothetical protein